jgi:hypothetical protein
MAKGNKKAGVGQSGEGGKGGETGRMLKKQRRHHTVIKNADIAINKRNDDQAEFLRGTTAGLYCIKDPHGKRDVNCEVFLYRGEKPSVRLTDGFGLGMPLSYLVSQDMSTYFDKVKHHDPAIEGKWHEIFSAIRPFLDEKLILAQREAYKDTKRAERAQEVAVFKERTAAKAHAEMVAAMLATAKCGLEAALRIVRAESKEYVLHDQENSEARVLVKIESHTKIPDMKVLKVIDVSSTSPLHGVVKPGFLIKLSDLVKEKLENNPTLSLEEHNANGALHSYVRAFVARHKVKLTPPKDNVIPIKKDHDRAAQKAA